MGRGITFPVFSGINRTEMGDKPTFWALKSLLPAAKPPKAASYAEAALVLSQWDAVWCVTAQTVAYTKQAKQFALHGGQFISRARASTNLQRHFKSEPVGGPSGPALHHLATARKLLKVFSKQWGICPSQSVCCAHLHHHSITLHQP